MTDAGIEQTKAQIDDLSRLLDLYRWACDPQADQLARRIGLLVRKVESLS